MATKATTAIKRSTTKTHNFRWTKGSAVALCWKCATMSKINFINARRQLADLPTAPDVDCIIYDEMSSNERICYLRAG